MSKYLLVEDEADLADLISGWLSREGHVVEVVNNGQEALNYLKVYKYDAIILDWLLPGLDGLALCSSQREAGNKTPILMLTAKSELDDKERGLDAGADDFLPKPFHLRELSARLRAIVRRHSPAVNHVLTINNLIINCTTRQVMRDGQEIHMERKEFNLLEFFARNPNRTFSSEALFDRVWESESNASPETVRSYIKSLRKKLDQKGKPSLIATAHGVGYRLDAPLPK